MTASIGSSKDSKKKKSKKSSREPKIRIDEGLGSDDIDDFDDEVSKKPKKSKKSKKGSRDRSNGFVDIASSHMNSTNGSKDSKGKKLSKGLRPRGPSKAVKDELMAT